MKNLQGALVFGASCRFNVGMKDYYRILEIHPDASLEVMNKAYRTLVYKYHPDRYHSSDKSRMDRQLQEINEAYEVLSNEGSRRRYDNRYKKVMAEGGFDRSSGKSNRQRLRKVLLWAFGTFIVLQVLLKPLMGSPAVRLLVLGLLIFLFLRFYARPAHPS